MPQIADRLVLELAVWKCWSILWKSTSFWASVNCVHGLHQCARAVLLTGPCGLLSANILGEATAAIADAR